MPKGTIKERYIKVINIIIWSHNTSLTYACITIFLIKKSRKDLKKQFREMLKQPIIFYHTNEKFKTLNSSVSKGIQKMIVHTLLV